MSGSVELRVPFLDHKIVEFAAQVPDNLKIKWRKNNVNHFNVRKYF